MNELFRVNCKTDYNTAWHDYLGLFVKSTFIFYEDKFEIHQKGKLILTVPYENFIEKQTDALYADSLMICCKNISRFSSEAHIIIRKITTEDRYKILSIIKK